MLVGVVNDPPLAASTDLDADPRIELVRVSCPATAAGAFNGDVCDILPAGRDAWNVLVADACGMGAIAAIDADAVRRVFKTATARALAPAHAAALANQALDARLCTAVFARLQFDRTGVDVELVRAGHPPPIVLRGDASLELIQAGGPILSIVPEATYPSTRVRLNSGDSLLLYTDGAVELAHTVDDPKHFYEAVRSAGNGALISLVEALERRARLSGGGTLRDDFTVLALRVKHS
jgi:serine phosphatase RsbU (regulator of sigma subunit)